MEQRVKDALEAAFPGIAVETEIMPGGRITGSVIWDGFEELDDVDRQNEIRRVLRERLGDDTRQVSVLFAYTPREIRAMKAA